MTKRAYILLLLLLTPTASVPQRYGRPYNFAEKPQLLLEVRVEAKSYYFRVSALRSMRRSVCGVTDPITNVTHAYEGVSLEQVSTQFFESKAQSIEIEFGPKRNKMKVLLTDLDSQAKPIIVDKIDGKELSGYAPFDLALKLRGKPVQIFSDVESNAVKSSG